MESGVETGPTEPSEPVESSENGASDAPAAAPAAPSAPLPDLEDPDLLINREVSWMAFNDRVLQLAEDKSIPLIERLKFCAIWESNLDEFFMVRVADLHDQVAASLPAGADGMKPVEQLEVIRELAIAQRERIESCFVGELLPKLEDEGIRIVTYEEASSEQRQEIDEIFERQVFPALTPLVFGVGRPFPYISNLSLSLLVILRDPEQEAEVLARVKVPKELLRRFLPIGDGSTFVPLEEVISNNLESLFPGMEVVDRSVFRVTRDADFEISDEPTTFARPWRRRSRRRFGEVIRLEVSSDLDAHLLERLEGLLNTQPGQVYVIDGWIGHDDLFDVAAVTGHVDIRFKPFVSATQSVLQGPEGEGDILAAMREGDILVHHPYDSFTTSVEAFVHQAVADPDVLAIKQTVYRTSDDSPLVPALISAAERGIQAVCMVELKARFDEQANITWAKKLEKAGVHVVYGIPAMKTHAKCILVARREGDGVRHYAHVGTGNYNPKTARLYTDLGLFTTDPDICADIAEMFNHLTGYARPQSYRKALIAPYNIASDLLAEIDRTIESHSPETPSRIRMKMNSLLDPAMIRALYRASQAGVPVELNVRGICALTPGVPGVSENISVVSVLGRFLEHSRIYCFERGDERHVYTGSADLMPRNLYKRIELIIPIEDPSVQAEMVDILELSLSDTAGAWTLDAEGGWTRRGPAPGEEPFSVQQALIERSAGRAAEAQSPSPSA